MPPRSGVLPAEVSEAIAAGVTALPPPPGELETSQIQTVWNIPVLLVGFSDAPLAISGGQFDFALFDSSGNTPTGSVVDYYNWVSGGRLQLRGRVVAAVQLPQTRAYYGYGSWGLNRIATPNNAYGMVRDALYRCHTSVSWGPFDRDADGYVDMLWVIHAGIGGEASPDRNDLWSVTSAMSGYWNDAGPFETQELVPGSVTQHFRLDRFSILPELSALHPGTRSEIGVYCHEFGHALGLPDLYDTSGGGTPNVGLGNWSLMATGGWGGNNASPESPTHMGAWPMLFLGWRTTARPTRDTTLTLPPLAQGTPVLELWNEGRIHAEHFLVEYRERTGFDRTLPGDGLIVYQVDESIIGQRLQANAVNAGPIPGLRILEADGRSDLRLGTNRADGSDPFPGTSGRRFVFSESATPNTRSLTKAPTHVALLEIHEHAPGVRLTAQVRAPGWLPPAVHSGAGFAPYLVSAPAPFVALTDAGDVHVVTSESVAGRAQIVLRSRRGEEWQASTLVSASPSGAFEPSIAGLPGGDLVVVWSDVRGGRAALYYRARVRGTWTAETGLWQGDGHVRSPAVAADTRGNVFIAWVNDNGLFGPLMAMRVPYLSPFGRPRVLTSGLSAPLGATVAARGDGGAVVVWPERAVTPQTLFFTHFHPDSVSAAPRPLWSPPAGRDQASPSAIVGPQSALHVAWTESGAGVHQVHYQRRSDGTGLGYPTRPDTTLESAIGPVQNASLALGSDGFVHLAFEEFVGGTSIARYWRWEPGLGWDASSTSVSADAGSAARPAVVARSASDVTVLYYGFAPQGPQLTERRRVGDTPAADAPVLSLGPALHAVLRAAPNPLRAGQGLVLTWRDPSSAAAERLDVLDLAGRRVASVTASGPPSQRRASLAGPETAHWAPGLYLARATGGAVQRMVVLR